MQHRPGELKINSPRSVDKSDKCRHNPITNSDIQFGYFEKGPVSNIKLRSKNSIFLNLKVQIRSQLERQGSDDER
jgi:hypothetical protein